MWFTESFDSLLIKNHLFGEWCGLWAICCKKDWFFMCVQNWTPFIQGYFANNVNCLSPRMLCAKFGWNCLGAFRWQWILFHPFGAYSKTYVYISVFSIYTLWSDWFYRHADVVIQSWSTEESNEKQGPNNKQGLRHLTFYFPWPLAFLHSELIE